MYFFRKKLTVAMIAAAAAFLLAVSAFAAAKNVAYDRNTPGTEKIITGYYPDGTENGVLELFPSLKATERIDGKFQIVEYRFVGVADEAFDLYSPNVPDSTKAFLRTVKELVINDGIRDIGTRAFSNLPNLKKVTFLGDAVLGIEAFSDCASLTEVTFEGAATVGERAFARTPLQKIVFNGPVTFQNEALDYAMYLNELDFAKPDEVAGMHHLRNSAFLSNMRDENGFCLLDGVLLYYAGNQEKVVVPDGVKRIGASAFERNQKIQSITLPDSVTSVGARAFAECWGLAELRLPDSLTEIGKDAFLHTVWLEAQPEGSVYVGKIFYTCKGDPQEVTVAEGTECIAEGAFAGCAALGSIAVPDSVTRIGKDAFLGTAWYESLPDGPVYAGKVACSYKGTMREGESLVIRDDIKGIADFAFADRPELASVELPDSVTTIGASAFSGCTGLKKVALGHGIAGVTPDIFAGCGNISELAVGKAIEMYTLAEIFPVPDNTEQFALKKVRIVEDTTAIVSGAFEGYPTVEEIELPNSVAAIGRDAFRETAWFRSYPGEGIIYAGRVAIGFLGESPLDPSIELKPGTVGVADGAFDGLDWPETVALPDGVVNIGEAAFRDCKKLKEVRLPERMQQIGAEAFSGCDCLTEVRIPHGIQTIEKKTFYDCKALVSVIFPDSLTKIEKSAFESCVVLNDIYYEGTENDWRAVTVGERNAAITQYTTVYYHHYEHTKKEAVHENIIPANCTQPGSYESVIYCAACGKELSRSPAEEPARGHLWGDPVVTVVPTCAAEGTMTVTCQICDYEWTEPVPKSETHIWDDGAVVKPATELEEGTMAYTCQICGKVELDMIPRVTPAEPGRAPGDVDGDGKLSAADARLALRRSVGLEAYQEGSAEYLACDVDRDGTVSAADARLILRASVGLEDPAQW